MRSVARRQTTRRRDEITLAHLFASLIGISKPPPLHKLLSALEPKAPPPQMSNAEIADVMSLWGAASKRW